MLAEETKDEEKDAEGPAGGRSLFTLSYEDVTIIMFNKELLFI